MVQKFEVKGNEDNICFISLNPINDLEERVKSNHDDSKTLLELGSNM